MEMLSEALTLPQFTGSYGETLASSIRESNSEAAEMIRKGESVRWAHQQGCTNSSRSSTVEGVLCIGRTMIEAAVEDDATEDNAFFGSNIRRSMSILKRAFSRHS
jgi:hypothetical protein